MTDKEKQELLHRVVCYYINNPEIPFEKWFNEKMQEHNIKPSGDQNQDCFNVALKESEKIL